MTEIGIKDEKAFNNLIESFSDSRIVRIELVDLLSPYSRTTDDVAKLLGFDTDEDSDDRRPDDKPLSASQKKAFASEEFDDFRDSFGLSTTSFNDLVANYNVDYSIRDRIPRRSLSFSLEGGLHGSWAPNGYGKTYAISNVLCSLQKSRGQSPLDKFENFIELTYLQLSGESNSGGLFETGWHASPSSNEWRATKKLSDFTSNNSKLIPFRQINYLLEGGKIVSICLKFEGPILDSFDFKIRQTDENFRSYIVIDDIKFPNWLTQKGSLIYQCDNSKGNWFDAKVMNAALNVLVNLKVDYVEIPEMSYNKDTFGELSNLFIKHIS